MTSAGFFWLFIGLFMSLLSVMLLEKVFWHWYKSLRKARQHRSMTIVFSWHVFAFRTWSSAWHLPHYDELRGFFIECLIIFFLDILLTLIVHVMNSWFWSGYFWLSGWNVVRCHRNTCWTRASVPGREYAASSDAFTCIKA